jgi:hypothetical protein
MPNLAPIDYGSAVAADTSGAREAQGVVGENAARAKQQLSQVAGTAGQMAGEMAQAILKNQALRATADAKETQSQTLDFIESHPYIAKEDLRSRMSAEDYESWHASLDPDDKQRDAVPMYKAGGALFESVAKKSRDDYSKYISSPIARSDWVETDRSETTNFKADRLNRVMAGQMVQDQRAEAKANLDKLLDSAKDGKDYDLAVAAMRANSFLSPAEKDVLTQNALQMKDRGPSMRSMAGLDVDGMREELTKLENPDTAKQFFPHTNDEQRLHLQTQLRSHINLVESMKRAGDDLEEKRRKQQDDRTLGTLAQSLVQGEDPSALLRAVKTRSYEDRGDASSTSFQSGFYETPRMMEAYHLLGAAIKNQKDGPQTDAPGALRAITSLYSDTGDLYGDKFRKAMLTSGGVEIPGFGHFDPETQLSSASYKAQLSRLDTLASTDRGRVEREREAGHQLRVTSVLLENGVSASDLTNPRVRLKYDAMQAFMEDAVKRQAQARGRVLTSDEETMAMSKAAKVYKDNAGRGRFFANDVGKDGINIKTARGNIEVGPTELAAIHTTAKELGAPFATIQPDALKNTVTDFYENYDAPAQAKWRETFGESLNVEDQYRVYWRAKFMQSGDSPAVRVQKVITKMAQEEQLKKLGGKK